MDEKINMLLPKSKRNVLPLRDPINTDLFEIFRTSAGSNSKYKQDLKIAQLTTAYTILFFTGLRDIFKNMIFKMLLRLHNLV